jgi:hypothetical protein
MATLPDAVLGHDREVRRITVSTLAQMRSLWRRLGDGDWDVAWRTLGPQLMAVMVASQVAVGRQADAYVGATVAALGLPDAQRGHVSPTGLAGVASDGRPLASLLYESIIAARAAGAAGSLDTPQALTVGRAHLDRIVLTQVADASRVAESVATVTRTRVTGWVRMVTPPCCPQCAILAGRFYRWSSGFERHPNCDCRHIPASEDVAGDLRTDPKQLFDRGQVRGLSKSDATAIADGADPGQVINAHRGMSTAQVYGRNLKITTEGITSRGLAGNRLGNLGNSTRNGRTGKTVRNRESKTPRLRPESIYKIAGNDRDEALRLLKRFGYIL